jgi:hypothetical protein
MFLRAAHEIGNIVARVSQLSQQMVVVLPHFGFNN